MAAGSKANIGHVYVLTNPALVGMVKIGFTERPEPEIRAMELSSHTAVPMPFSVHSAWLVEHPSRHEARIHLLLSSCRVSKDREFFRIDADEAARQINGLIHGTEDATEALRLEVQSLTRLYRKYPASFRHSDAFVEQIEKLMGQASS